MPELTSRQLQWGLFLAMLPFLAVVVARWAEPVAADAGDYAHYLLHAKAIAEGRPYSDIGYIYTHLNLVGPQNQPPGWPLFLAPFVAVFGVHSQVFAVLMVMLVAGFAILAGVFIARRDNPVTGVLVAAVIPLALGTSATNSVLSDPFFCVLVWLTIWAADTENPWTARRSLAIALLVVAAISVRVAGVALLPTVVAFSVIRHGPKHVGRLLPVAAVLAAVALLVFAAADQIPFLNRLHLQGRFSPELIRGFVRTYRDAALTQTLYPLPGDRLNDLYHLAVAPLVVVGAIHVVRKTANSILWYLAVVYGAMLFLAPVRDGRYAWPLAPILVWWLVSGIRLLVAAVMRSARATHIAMAHVAVVAVLCIGAAAVQAAEPREKDFVRDPDTVEVFDLLRRLHEERSIRVMFVNPRVLSLETGIPAMGVPFGTHQRVLAEIGEKQLTHIVLRLGTGLRRTERDALGLVDRCRDAFPEILRNDAFTVRVVAGMASCVPAPAGP